MKKKTYRTVTGKRYDGMMGRCYRENDKSYLNYGGRGIRVHGNWIKDINAFREWFTEELNELEVTEEEFMANPRAYQLDRINTDNHYTPENCRLTDGQTNARNRRVRKIGITIMSAEGEEIIC